MSMDFQKGVVYMVHMGRDAPKKLKGMALQLDVVVFLVAVSLIIAVVLTSATSITDDSKVSRAKAELATLAVACSQYAYEIGEKPASIATLAGTKTKNGITYGPWIKNSAPKDPWGTAYQLTTDAKGFIVWSKGPSKSGSISASSFTSTTNKQLGFYTNVNLKSKTGVLGYSGRWGASL